MTADESLSLVVRASAATLWSFVVWHRATERTTGFEQLVRRLMGSVIVFGLWALALGGLGPLDLLPSGLLRVLYTVFTGYALVVAVVLLWARRA